MSYELLPCVQIASIERNVVHVFLLQRIFPHSPDRSMLVLDDLKCHKQAEFVLKLAESYSVSPRVPPHYTSILQPCDMGHK